MPWFPNPNGGAPIQADTNPNPAGGSYGYYSDPSYNGPPPSTGGSSTSPSPSSPSAPPPTQTAGAAQLAAGINSLLGAISSGNKQAFDEAVRQFNQTFGLDQQKFAESVRQYNEGLAVTQAGLTGAYQGQPTMPALQAYANQFGTWGVPTQGEQTLAAQNQAFTQGITQAGVTGLYQGAPTLAAQQQAYAQQLGAIEAAASLQANPFRQQQVLGQLGPLLTGVGGVPGFAAPNTVAGVGTQGGNTQGGLGYMQQIIDDIKNPGANQASVQGVLNAIPTPNKINSQDFLRAAPSTQSMILQGMSEKYGLDPADSLAQIKNTLPSFQAPTTFGTIRG